MPFPWNMSNGDICFDSMPENVVHAYDQMDDAIRLYLASQALELDKIMAQYRNLTLINDLRSALVSFRDYNLYAFLAKVNGDCSRKWTDSAADCMITCESRKMVGVAKGLVRKMHPDKRACTDWPPVLATQ
eukprot:1237466-Rhodomonas_salina.1